MIQVHRSESRGHANFGWLDTYHTFSFGDYYNPRAMGFRALRVINEDKVAGGAGFPMHPHRDMEIITYVIDGELAHKDTLGSSAVIRPGEVQHMSAGTGIRHSEFNPSPSKTCHLLQIWILPDKEGHTPRYGQKSFEPLLKDKNLALVAAQEEGPGRIGVHQDMQLFVGKPKAGEALELPLAQGRHGWIQVVKGDLEVNGEALKAGDALSASGETALNVVATEASEFLFFDLA